MNILEDYIGEEKGERAGISGNVEGTPRALFCSLFFSPYGGKGFSPNFFFRLAANILTHKNNLHLHCYETPELFALSSLEYRRVRNSNNLQLLRR